MVGTGDAITLATALFARDVMEVGDLIFHTFDEGKRSGHEGKCVPILDMERWYPIATRPESVANVCTLDRSKPFHPQPDLLPTVSDGLKVTGDPLRDADSSAPGG